MTEPLGREDLFTDPLGLEDLFTEVLGRDALFTELFGLEDLLTELLGLELRFTLLLLGRTFLAEVRLLALLYRLFVRARLDLRPISDLE